MSLYPQYTESKFGSSTYAYVIERHTISFKEYVEIKNNANKK